MTVWCCLCLTSVKLGYILEDPSHFFVGKRSLQPYMLSKKITGRNGKMGLPTSMASSYESRKDCFFEIDSREEFLATHMWVLKISSLDDEIPVKVNIFM